MKFSGGITMSKSINISYSLPFIPIRGEIFLPYQQINIKIGRESSKLAVRVSEDSFEKMIILGFLEDDSIDEPEFVDLLPVGLLAKIEKVESIDNKNLSISFSVIKRVKLLNIGLNQLENSIINAEEYRLKDFPLASQIKMFLNKLKTEVELFHLNNEKIALIDEILEKNIPVEEFLDRVSSHLSLNNTLLHKLLLSNSIIDNMKLIFEYIDDNVKTSMTKSNGSVRWEKIDGLSTFIFIFGIINAVIVFISGIVLSVDYGDLFLFVGLVASVSIVFASVVIRNLISGFSIIVRNNSEQIEERNN
jgi:ATP-dependent Lon protease